MADSPEFLRWRASRSDLCLRIDPSEPVALLPFGVPGNVAVLPVVPLVEIDSGQPARDTSSPPVHRGYSGTHRLRYVRHEETPNALTIVQRDAETGLVVTTSIDSFPTAIRFRNRVRNDGPSPVSVRYVSTLQFPITASEIWRDARVRVPYNSHRVEFRWETLTLQQAGLVYPGHPEATTQGRFAAQATGTRSSGIVLPAGVIDIGDLAFSWQIENSGGWLWTIDDEASVLRVRMSGPTHLEHHWRIELAPGEEFETVPAALSMSDNGFQQTLRDLTTYRRAIRRPHVDNERLPIIFNDYMNCLMGDPSTEKLLPLIGSAARLGAEYFVIDAGWYSDDKGWWSTVGEWKESSVRFPGGLSEVTEKIRQAGMVPGLWLEPEVVGEGSPVAGQLPDDAFFCREGQRVLARSRYQLDFRNPLVVQHMDGIVDRLVRDYGVGYFKFDYNINPGHGTEVDSVSLGEGLLGHNRAFLSWVDGLLDRHHGLVIENCASGGLRMDYAQLSHMSLQSTSDQTSPLFTGPIAASAPSAVTPEQAAIWAYPSKDYDDELNVLTMVNALLGRVHLSGHIDWLEPHQTELVAEALTVYRQIRGIIKDSLPSWPMGLPGWYDDWLAVALDHEGETLLAVWHRGKERSSVHIDVPAASAELIYPTSLETDWKWDAGTLELSMGPNSARLFRLSE